MSVGIGVCLSSAAVADPPRIVEKELVMGKSATLERPQTAAKITRVTDDPRVVETSGILHRIRTQLGEAESAMFNAEKVSTDELIRRIAAGESPESVQPDRAALRQRVHILRQAQTKAAQDHQSAWQDAEARLMEDQADEFRRVDAAVRDALVGLVAALDGREALLGQLARQGIDGNRLRRRVRSFRQLQERTIRVEADEWVAKVK